MKEIFILLIAFIFCFPNKLPAQSDIELSRVEPPFWWIGMKSSQLQLMLYGKNIAELTPSIQHEDIHLDRIISVENKNYLFLDLNINDVVESLQFTISLNDGNETILNNDYSLKDRKEGSCDRVGFNSSDVMYLITPDRFVNGDANNDSIDGLLEKANRIDPDGRHGGDIAGISSSLEYIQDMGFTAIWVNPLLENDQPKYSYHGYSTTDFYKIDERFGSNEDYRDLCEKAENMGIKVIMDMILNHCGSEHWWMEDLPCADWINFDNNFQPTNHKRTTVQDIYASEYDKRHFSDGWFVRTMPDMNQRNPLFAQYLIQNTIWWIEFTGLSGIRMDTYPYPDMHFMTEWTRRIMEEYPYFNIVGEEWSLNPAIVSFWQRGKENHNGYTSYLPSVMDFPLQNALVQALIEDESWSDGFIKLYEMLANDFLYPDPANLVVFPDNHDMSRIFTQLNEDPELYKMAMAYLLTIRGVPQIYYGTEILMNNPGTTKHGIIRSDFPGGWAGDQVNAISQNGLTDAQKDAQEFLQKILRWRKDATVVHTGQLKHFAPKDGVYVFFRYNEDEIVMIILNKNKNETRLKRDAFIEVLGTMNTGRDIISDKIYRFEEDMILPARSSLILEIQP